VRVAAATAAGAAGSLNLRLSDVTLAVPASALRELYRSHLAGGSQTDAWLEIILADRGQGEAEAALKELPRGAKVVSRVWEIIAQSRRGREISPQLYFPSGLLLSFNVPTATLKKPEMYYRIPYNNSWQPVSGVYAPQVARLLFPGKYMMIDCGGK
jgi:hypothetical protein